MVPIDALSTQTFQWLSNVPIDALVEMRLNNENEVFRKRLSDSISILNDVDLRNLDRVARKATTSIGGLLNDYGSEAKKLDDKYRLKYKQLASQSWLSLGAFCDTTPRPITRCNAGLDVCREVRK